MYAALGFAVSPAHAVPARAPGEATLAWTPLPASFTAESNVPHSVPPSSVPLSPNKPAVTLSAADSARQPLLMGASAV
jgi:hypothetical protein